AYKATRQKLSEELQQDFDRSVERIAQLLEAFGVPLVGVEGYEADDVIGTLATRAAGVGFHVVIVSGDKDFYQLIGPNVVLLNPGRGWRGTWSRSGATCLYRWRPMPSGCGRPMSPGSPSSSRSSSSGP